MSAIDPPMTVSECELETYSPLAPAAIVDHENIVSVGFSLASGSPRDTPAITPTSLSVSYPHANSTSSCKDCSFPRTEASNISSLLAIDLMMEESDMIEKLLSCEIEMADSDVTVTLPNLQESAFMEHLVSLYDPTSLSKLSEICPIPLQITSKILVLPRLRTKSKSETEKTGLANTSVASPISTMISPCSERVDTDDDLFVDTEQSGLETGVTTASWQTELTSPVISVLGDHRTLPWGRRMSQLCPEESSPLLSLYSQDMDEIRDGSTHDGARYPITRDQTLKEDASAPASSEKMAVSTFESVAPELQPPIRSIANIEPVADSDTYPRSPLVTTSPNTGFNPLAVEWHPGDRARDMSTKDSPKDSPDALPPSFNLSNSTVKDVEVSHAGVPEQIDSGHVLEWAKNVPRLQLPAGTRNQAPSSSVQTLASAVLTPNVTGESRIHKLAGVRRRSLLATPQMTTATLLDTTPGYQRPTLAQRRAEKYLGQAPVAVVQSAPNTTPLESVKLPSLLDTSVSAAALPYRATYSPSSQGPPSQPLRIASHTQSLTWKRQPNPLSAHHSVNPEIARWTKAEQDLLKMGLIKRVPGKADSGSFVIPKTFEQWLEFRAGRAEDELLENAGKIRQKNFELKEADRLRKVHGIDDLHDCVVSNQGSGKRVKIGPAMGGKDFHDGRGAVLANTSIWSPWYEPTEERPEAMWPSLEEMREEGDERHTSAFGRFPALPRVPGNPTVVWKVKPMLPPIPFDEVWKLPDKDTWAELHAQKFKEPDEDHMERLVGQALLNAINV